MSDIIDRANEVADAILNEAVRKRQKTLTNTGYCKNCDEKISTGNFCDADCRQDYEARYFRKFGKPL